MFLRCAISGFLFAAAVHAQLTPKQTADNLASFEQVWRTVRDRHPDPKLNGLNWQAIHDSTRPAIAKARTIGEVRDALRAMVGKLGASHYAIIPADYYPELARIPSAASASPSGITPVVIDGKAMVGSVDAESAAAKAGVKQGMVLSGINGADVASMLRLGDPRLVQRSVSTRLNGGNDAPLDLDVVDGDGKSQHIAVGREPGAGQGKLVTFGNLPEMRVTFEARELPGGTGYVKFNEFLDPVSMMPKFEAAVNRFAKAPGMILDLRGNPGGIGIMAMGVAGFFIDKEGLKLGEMKMRETTLKFVIFPRPKTYAGPLAVLVDAGSASTAEILAQGLQDLGRARIFGTGTAGAALPSDIVRLPNGDGFQFPQAGYTSEKGRVLEGNGVKPDVQVHQTQDALLAGHDLVIDAANDWITSLRR